MAESKKKIAAQTEAAIPDLMIDKFRHNYANNIWNQIVIMVLIDFLFKISLLSRVCTGMEK